ncbi:MAG: Gfo/Idh/MocA family oxidoreductase, partial [Candidatus Hydrogenedentes bacterium]|nr:Gfo/Idh/MocA family oxidoreductase [Candidatus Hydrogenedentota bacterium]
MPKKLSPNEKVNLALVGCGGRGYENLKEVLGENIVALCDVDSQRASRALAEHPSAARYDDWRKLFDRADTFDAVIVSTPDHTHAPVSVAAMRLGKHVYCEKPLARTIHEARVMAETAREYGVATQMGTQGVSFDNSRKGIEMLRAGVIGGPREIHVWTDRAGTWWPQGVERPRESPPVPAHVNWDVWLGTAPARAYHPLYHPFKWRGWKDFGSGAIGDMGIHNAAIAYLGLGLGMPDAVTIKSSPLCDETFPVWSELCLDFPAHGPNPALKMYWYDGGHKPSQSLIAGGELNGNGCIIVGEKGTLYSVDWAGDVHHLYPEDAFKEYAAPAPILPRVKSHHQEWIDACKGGPEPMCNFADFAAPMTEIMQLGNLAVLVGRDLKWDTKAMKSPDC